MIKEPIIRKDLKVKMGTRTEVLWTNVEKQCKIQIKQCEDELIIQNQILILAENKIKEEKKKFK